MEIPHHLIDANATLSEANREFLAFVERNPECFDRSAFALLDEPHPWIIFPLQSWPIFVSADKARQMRRISVAISRLIRNLPEKLFGNDPDRIAEHTGVEPREARFLASVLRERKLLQGVMARGDFVYAADGLKCLEMNMASVLGGLAYSSHADVYRRIPVLDRFLAEAGLEVRVEDNIEALFSFLFAEARSLAGDGELNFVLAVDSPEHEPSGAGSHLVHRLEIRPDRQEYFTRRWRDFLRAQGTEIRGQARLCELRDLEEHKDLLYLEGRRIHAVIEYHSDATPRALVMPWLAGNLRLYNGPLTSLYADKRNLALLSELADSELFRSEERALIHAHVPWTRRVRSAEASYRGRRRPLSELLLAERENLVLKPGQGFSGLGVAIGRLTPREEWEQAVETALADGGWVVLEYVDSLPLVFQGDREQWAPYYVVWGLFSFGEVAGGSFLRMTPRSRPGVISAKRGATEGLFFEVEES